MEPPSSELLARRPLLKLALTADPQLEKYLIAEKGFWQKLDHLWLNAYTSIWEPYENAVSAESPSDRFKESKRRWFAKPKST